MSGDELRIGDTEREAALRDLGTHMSEGRLDLAEYGDRTARVATAKTRGELMELFGDLPDPRPRFDAPPPAWPATVGAAAPAPAPARAPARWAMTALVPISGFVAVGLFIFAVRFWPILLLPIVVMFLVSAIGNHGRAR